MIRIHYAYRKQHSTIMEKWLSKLFQLSQTENKMKQDTTEH